MATGRGALSGVDQAVVHRVAQEALRNVVKHCGAKHAVIRVSVSDGGCDLAIEDDGVGFDAGTAEHGPEAGHLGLSVVRDLTLDAGASLEIAVCPGSAANGGTLTPVRPPGRTCARIRG